MTSWAQCQRHIAGGGVPRTLLQSALSPLPFSLVSRLTRLNGGDGMDGHLIPAVAIHPGSIHTLEQFFRRPLPIAHRLPQPAAPQEIVPAIGVLPYVCGNCKA